MTERVQAETIFNDNDPKKGLRITFNINLFNKGREKAI